MSLAPWRSPLSRALHRNRSLPYAKYVQLATVQPNGQPANRTIVFRGFLNDTNQLQFVTDSRSEKVKHIAAQPWGELCWYFPTTREQFRLAGILTLVTADEPTEELRKARQTLWQNLSDSARIQFAWPDPAQRRGEDDAFSPPPPDATNPLVNFCLLLLNPTRVDHLELRGNPQSRYLHTKGDYETWSSQEVNP